MCNMELNNGIVGKLLWEIEGNNRKDFVNTQLPSQDPTFQ